MTETNTITVSWFSAGVSSAVATKLAIDLIDHIIYTHIDNQHPDTMRFVLECEQWFEKPVIVLQSKYKNVENVCRAMSYIRGPHGAPCTNILKRRVRKEWESDNGFFNWFRYVWGMDCSESDRADRLRHEMSQQEHCFPLIDRGLNKEDAHKILNASGIKRPAMYDLGYSNNNCVGCVKGGKGYWNKIRTDFPDVFGSMSKLEREIGASCLNGIYLDELDPKAGRGQKPIVEDCGIYCEMLRM